MASGRRTQAHVAGRKEAYLNMEVRIEVGRVCGGVQDGVVRSRSRLMTSESRFLLDLRRVFASDDP